MSTRAAPRQVRSPPGPRLDDQVGHLLRRAYQRAAGNLVARVGRYELTAVQFAVLARLAEHGNLSQNRLGREVDMEPANIKAVVDRLMRRGLVATERDPADRRLVLVTLTVAGEALLRELWPLAQAGAAATLAPLKPAERRLLLQLLRRLL